MLKKDFGSATLQFETERGVQERTVLLRKAFWLWPVIITAVLAVFLIWFLTS